MIATTSTYRPTSRRRGTSPTGGWLSGLVLGVASGFLVIELGVIGLTVLALAVLLIAWKGPRLPAAGALASGFGVLWTVLFVRVQITCGPGALFRDDGCSSDDLSPWILGSAGIFVVGLLLSAGALRRWAARNGKGADSTPS